MTRLRAWFQSLLSTPPTFPRSAPPSPSGLLQPSDPIHRVASAEKALQLAREFQQEERFDLFRGQVRMWRAISTYARLALANDGSAELASGRLADFVTWAHQQPHLRQLAEANPQRELDTYAAIAQHYGLATNLMDFTTSPEVAAYFATSSFAGKGESGAIICARRADIVEQSRQGDSNAHHLEFVELRIPDLWRLHAQEGVFALCNSHFEDVFYGLEWILFPPTRHPIGRRPEQVYPVEKSRLEILLEQYFDREAEVEAAAVRRKIWEGIPGPKSEWNMDEDPGRSSKYGLPRQASWDRASNSVWRSTVPTVYAGQAVVVALSPLADETSFVELLTADTKLRGKCVSWKLPGDLADVRTEEYLDELWNGIRALPYSDVEVARAMATCFHLSRSGETPWPDGLNVAFAAQDSTPYRANVSWRALQDCLAVDMDGTFDQIWQGKKRSPSLGLRDLLAHVYYPDYLFDFQRFATLFAEQVVPVQVVFRTKGKSILYSPGDLKTFGLP